MFNRGIDALLTALPEISGLTTVQLRRLLTTAWIEATDSRIGSDAPRDPQLPGALRRLATALEVHSILPLEISLDVSQACAFVAAEALMIAEDLAPQSASLRGRIFGSVQRTERVEAALLYLIAGYDANANLTVRGLQARSDDHPDGQISVWTLDKILSLLRLEPYFNTRPPLAAAEAPLRDRIRHELWRRIGAHVAEHLDWLMSVRDDDPQAGVQLRILAEQLEDRDNPDRPPAAHPDLHHLLLLLASACDSTAGRALRSLLPPPDDDDSFLRYRAARSATRPLLWPAAQDYAARALPGPHAHAVVAVPTGSGKSSVAELAVAQALVRGWVLYLAPTNALVGQIRRHLADVFGQERVREFIGGAEYTQLEGESLTDIADRQILVMTPEKCSLALRQNPGAFGRLSLCVLDEAHLLGDRGGRGAIAELVLAEVMHRSGDARILLMSALVANPGDLADWLQAATATPAIVVDAPWRPTRTLRAIVGLDKDRATDAATGALERLNAKPARFKRERFGAPLAMLAGLQGPWRTTENDDYALVATDIEAPLAVGRNGKAVLDGYCTPATAAVVQRLGERGDNVLAFLPRSRHDSFAAADKMDGFGPVLDHGAAVEAFLDLAEVELGVETKVRETLAKGVAVHTSALLREEQRASEVAFEHGTARAMFATGTMAQGLNLPATAVVIGGTSIGDDRTQRPQEAKAQARAQLLNAIGRAGRAHVAPRSIAIVVPNKALVLSTSADAARAVTNAEFLQDEDASSIVKSSLTGLITDILEGRFDMAAMNRSEQSAFTFLTFTDERRDTSGVIAKTWAAYGTTAQQMAEHLASTLRQAGQAFLNANIAPDWVSLAAHRSGVALPETLHMYARLRSRLLAAPPPETVTGWVDLLIDILAAMPPLALSRILPHKAYGTSRLSDIYNEHAAQRRAGWDAYRDTVRAWITGQPLIQMARHIQPPDRTVDARRGPQSALPRTITVVNDGFRFGLSLAAGALVSILTTGDIYEPNAAWSIPPSSMRMLNLLPIAVRSGADTPESLAWIRAGVHTRVIAHRLSTLLPAPPGQTDEELQHWCHGRLRDLEDGASLIQSPEDERAVRALLLARTWR